VAVSSAPFLLPLLLQSVLGLSVVAAGAALSAYFAGNFLGIFHVPRMLRRFGFRRVLMVNSVLTGVSLVAMGFISSGLGRTQLWALLFAAGIVRSVQLHSQSTLTVSEIPADLHADASTLSSMLLQASASLSVVLATGALNGAAWLAGESSPGRAAFRGAFVAMAGLSVVGAWCFRALSEQVGAEMVGAAPAASGEPEACA
jgi:fucose permease